MISDPWFRNRLIRDGLLKAIHERMSEDPSVYILGEGAHMKVHFDAPAIESEFPERVITLPISEDANTNFAVGLSLTGITPIVDVITSDFLYRTMDAICNTVAKTHYVREPKPFIIRAEFITGGPTTGQRIESLFTHIPGLNVVVPSNPADAYGLMRTALRTPGATLFFEDRTIEDKTTGVTEHGTLPLLPQAVPFGAAHLARMGAPDTAPKLTIVSYGLMLRRIQVLLASQTLSGSVEVIDLRTLYPLDIATVTQSVTRTGSLLMVEPDVKHAGIGAEVVALVAESHPGTRIVRLGSPRVTIPACRDLHTQLLPSEDSIAAVVTRELAR